MSRIGLIDSSQSFSDVLNTCSWKNIGIPSKQVAVIDGVFKLKEISKSR